jgi:rhamnogalacturonyl hydrolase YesR
VEAAVCLRVGQLRVDLQQGYVNQALEVNGGVQDLLWETEVAGVSLCFMQEQQSVLLENPAEIPGYDNPWLYMGTSSTSEIEPDLTTVQSGQYWQVDVPGGMVRPFLENDRFGKWNYPLGVTLYGLLSAAPLLGSMRASVKDYVKAHVECATRYYAYSLWDRAAYGAAGINNQLSHIDSLDDCGSFASLMLELNKETPVAMCEEIAGDTAEYVEHQQCRLEDGAFCRGKAGLAEMNGTMWADDLYMSVPFLCRYYELTGDMTVLDDAANQYRQFRKYLYIPEKKIMSHVYLTDRKLANHIPWGRGNGWVLFSLSELLRVLPKQHREWAELLKFFQELCEGYRGLQDEDGMWHQVLTDTTSYQEASCTAMFVSAISRGIRHGWLQDIGKFREVVEKGWKGLSNLAADRYGNIYGICQGSGYSFRSTYYRDELTWVLNDPHGVGIVLMAGSECQKLRDWFAGR